MTFSKTIPFEHINTIALCVAMVALPFSTPLCHTGLIILTASWLISGEWKRKWNDIKKKPLLWPFLVFFILHLLGIMYSKDTVSGWFNAEKKIALFLVPLILSTIEIRSQYLNLLLKSFIFSSLVAVTICFGVALSRSIYSTHVPQNFDYSNSEEMKLLNPDISDAWSYFSYHELSSGIILHPTYLGLYILFSIILLFHFYKQESHLLSAWEKKGMISLFVLFSSFVLLLSSRTITIAYVLICIVGVRWVFLTEKKFSFALVAGIGILFIAVASVAINPIARYRSFQEFSKFSFSVEPGRIYTTSSSIRLSLWWLGIQSVNENNWALGNGTGDVIDTMQTTASKYGITNIINSYDPHNQFIYTYLSLGLIGLVCLLSCFAIPLFQSTLSGSFVYMCFLGLVTIACITESIFESQKGIVFFSLFNSLFIFQLQSVRSIQLTLSHG